MLWLKVFRLTMPKLMLKLLFSSIANICQLQQIRICINWMIILEGFAPDTLRRQHVMAEAIKFEAEMLMALDSRSQPLPTHTLMHTNTFCN